MTIRVGDRVRVVIGSGLDSEKRGVVTGNRNRDTVYVRYDEGTNDYMWRNRLQKWENDNWQIGG